MKPSPSCPIRAAALSGIACLFLGVGLATGRAQAQSSPAPADSTDPALTAARSPADAAARAKRVEEKFLTLAHASGRREIQLSELAATRANDPRVRTYAQQLVSDHQRMAQDLGPLLAGAGLDVSALDPGVSPSDAGKSGQGANPSPAPGASPPPAADSVAPGRSSDTARGTSTDKPTLNSTDAGSGAGGATYGAVAPVTGQELGIRGRWERMMDERKQRKLRETSGPDFDKAYLEFMIDELEEAVGLFEDGADGGVLQVQTFAAKYLPKLHQHLEQARQLEKSLK